MSQRMEPFAQEVVKFRQELHKHPETAFQETWTQKFVADSLTAHGIKCNTAVYKTAVVAEIKGKKGDGPIVALRADMDALPVTEMADANPRSQNEGKMHACGHDFHTAGLMGAALWFSKNTDKFGGTVRFLFQPAEEHGTIGGAEGMAQNGAVKDAAAVFGLHVWPDNPVGTVGICSSKAMASSDFFNLKITGVGGHISRPSSCNNPLYAAMEFANNMLWLESQRIHWGEEVVVGLGYLNGGTVNNVIPHTAELGGSVRCFNEEIRIKVKDQMTLFAQTIEKKYGVKCEYTHILGYSPTINDIKASEFFRKSCAKVEGVKKVEIPTAVMGAEDISAFFKRVPGAMAWVGSKKDDKSSFGTHHPSFFCYDETVINCSDIYIQVALDFLAAGKL